jgi:hypothetical protein
MLALEGNFGDMKIIRVFEKTVNLIPKTLKAYLLNVAQGTGRKAQGKRRSALGGEKGYLRMETS